MQLEEIKNYIVDNYCNFSLNDAVTKYKDLIAYLEKLDYDFDEFDIAELLKEDKILKLIETIINNKKTLGNDDIESIILEAYKNKKEIEDLNENLDTKIENDNNSSSDNDLLNIKEIKILTAEEEISFFEKIKEGNENAKKMFAYHNLRLVAKIASQYPINSNFSYDDYISIGTIGLMKAIEKFDPKKGFKFSTYAYWWIKQAISRTIMDQGRTIRVPVHMVESISKVNKIKKELFQKLNREPSQTEIANKLGISKEKLISIMKASQEPISLETPIGDEDDSALRDFITDENAVGPEEYVIDKSLKQDLNKTLSFLSEREQEVLKLRFGFGKDKTRTLEEVGNILGLSRERIRQIESEALRKLRRNSYTKELLKYYNIDLKKKEKIVKNISQGNTDIKDSLISYLKGYDIPLEEFIPFISKDEEKIFLKRYDKGFDQSPNKHLSKDELIEFNKTRNKVMRRYEVAKELSENNISLEKYFNKFGIPLEFVCSVMTRSEQNKLLEFYNNGFDEKGNDNLPDDVKLEIVRIKKHLLERSFALYKKQDKTSASLIPLTQYCNIYNISLDDILRLNIITSKEMEFLEEAYKDGFNKIPIVSYIDKPNLDNLQKNIIERYRKIKSKSTNISIKNRTLKAILNDYKIYINTLCFILTEDEMKFLMQLYPNGLESKPSKNISQEVEKEINDLILEIAKRYGSNEKLESFDIVIKNYSYTLEELLPLIDNGKLQVLRDIYPNGFNQKSIIGIKEINNNQIESLHKYIKKLILKSKKMNEENICDIIRRKTK